MGIHFKAKIRVLECDWGKLYLVWRLFTNFDMDVHNCWYI